MEEKFALAGNGDTAWFCLRSQPKHDHIAAAHLRKLPNVEVLFPRMVLKKSRPDAVKEVIEPLFPGYLFARFNPHVELARVRHASGVQTVVSFGNQLSIVPDAAIEDLRRCLNDEQLCHGDDSLKNGEVVRIGCGAFMGIQAIVSGYLPARQRVLLLLEFLGRLLHIEVSETEIVREQRYPVTALRV